MSQYIENNKISQNEVQKRYQKFQKTKKTYLRVTLLSIFIFLVSLIIFIIFILQYNSTSSQIEDYQKMIDAVQQKIYQFEHNRLLNLSSSNLKNITLNYGGPAFTAIDISNNNITDVDLITVKSHLNYIDLRNTSILILSNIITESIDQIRFSKTVAGLANSTFRLKSFPKYFESLLMFNNVTIFGLQQIIVNNSQLLYYFINNTMPDLKKLLLMNTSIELFQHKSSTLQELFIQSYNNLSRIYLDAKCQAGVTLELAGEVDLMMKNVKLVDFSKINAPHLDGLRLYDTSVANCNISKFPTLSYILLHSVKGTNSLDLKSFLELETLILNYTSIDSIIFPEQSTYFAQLKIQNSQIRKLQNIRSNSIWDPRFLNNTNLKEFNSNSFPKVQYIGLSTSIVSITANTLKSIKKLYSVYPQIQVKFPNLEKFSNNDVSGYYTNLYFPSGRLMECMYNSFNSVQVINLSNNNLNDSAISILVNNNTWSSSYIKYVNLKNNPIKNVSEAVKLISAKFPNADIDI